MLSPEEKKELQNCIRGSLIGGAVGDALGYAIEFDREKEIFKKYGPQGITEYELLEGKAIISDDTQMTLFTANGLLVGRTRAELSGPEQSLRMAVASAYQDWYQTQESAYQDWYQTQDSEQKELEGICWLLDVPELFAWRAPGNTCLSSLRQRAMEEEGSCEDFIGHPVNSSRGCGGVMRTAPMAFFYRPGDAFYGDIEKLDLEAAQLAAITHGHSLGYIPSALFNHVLVRILDRKDTMSMKEIVLEARDTIERLFAGEEKLQDFLALIDLAIQLSGQEEGSDLEHIHELGEGWVGDEALAIALYCALKYYNDFSKAMIVSVNHKGDSDSTGAIAGNIVGAWIGYEAIEEKWKQNLELSDVILELADDLYQGAQECCGYNDPVWIEKYVDCRRPQK